MQRAVPRGFDDGGRTPSSVPASNVCVWSNVCVCVGPAVIGGRLSVSEVVCTECQESSALSHWVAKCRAEVTLVQRSIEQPVFRNHLHYP